MRHPILVLAFVALSSATVHADARSSVDGAYAFTLNAAAVDDAPPTPAPFAKDTWTFQAYGSGTIGFDHSAIYLAHVGAGYHLANRFSINLEGVVGHLAPGDDQSEDGVALGFDLLLRWHFVATETFSIYLDGGAGMIWFDDAFPNDGTHQNFTPQVGLGFTARLSDRVHLMAGARWHHISNAAKRGIDRNPGFDGAMFYMGVIMPF